MTVITVRRTQDELRARRDVIFIELGITWDELVERHESGYLTPEQWLAWDELDGLNFLIDE